MVVIETPLYFATSLMVIVLFLFVQKNGEKRVKKENWKRFQFSDKYIQPYFLSFFSGNNIKLCITFVQHLQFNGIQNFFKYEHFYKLLYRIFKKQDYKTLSTGKM